MKSYFLRHVQVFFYALGQLARSPWSSFMSLSVIGITLALPAGLYVLIHNVQQLSSGLENQAQISLYLSRDLSRKATEEMKQSLIKTEGVSEVRYISPEEALEEFKSLSGFGAALSSLGKNPLPGVFVIMPKLETATPKALEQLRGVLAKIRGVEHAQLDMDWLRRLHAILDIGTRGVVLLALLLGMGVVVSIGNTIRLAVLGRRTEIEIIKLVGGTNAFVRRPFLYTGLLLGFFGGFLALILVQGIALMLSDPVRQLASLYASDYQLQGASQEVVIGLLAGSATLGIIGAWMATSRHLRDIEPS